MTEQNQTHPDADSYDPGASSLAGQVDPAVMAELLSIRSSIDNIDATLVYLLAERFKATQKVGFLKATHKLPAGDPGRETAQIARLRRLAAEAHLDPAFAEKFLNFIIGEVIRHHEAIAEDHEASLAAGNQPADALAADNQSAGSGRSGTAGHVTGAAGPAVSATA
jgi:chorismate mutase